MMQCTAIAFSNSANTFLINMRSKSPQYLSSLFYMCFPAVCCVPRVQLVHLEQPVGEALSKHHRQISQRMENL